MKKRFSGSVGWLVPLGAILLSLLCYKLDPVQLRALRNAAFDQYQRWDARIYSDSPVRVVDIDDESLSKLGQWPWPRTRLAELVARLQEAGAASIAFDIVFAEPDRTSPAAMLKTWNASPELEALVRSLPDHDLLFAQQIQAGRVVLGHALRNDAPFPKDMNLPFVVGTRGPSPLPFLHAHNGAVVALPALQSAAAGHGSFNFNADSDGIVRKAPLLLRMGDEIVPSLAAEALRVGLGAQGYLVTTSEAEGAGIESVKIGQYRVPTSREGEMWVRFSEGWKSRTVPAWKVLSGEAGADALRDRIVLVGTSAAGLMDLRFSPLGGTIPGVETHAHALDQILSGDHLIYPNWAPALEMGLILFGGLIVGAVVMLASALVSAVVVILIIAGAAWGAWYLYLEEGLLLDPATPALALIFTFVSTSLYRHVMAERRQRWVRQAFARYVSPNLVAHLVENPDALQLGGSRRECSFIFTDLAGFTTLMEKLDPAAAVTLLNEYLDKMIQIAFKHEGTLDRIVGDAVAIMFSAPVEQPDHRQRAVQCAEAMHHFAMQFTADAVARGIGFGITRMGVHTGEVTVGNFGGATIFDYRALGDPVNTASRLESINKFLGTLVCISEDTLCGTEGVVTRPVGKLILKGKSQALRVHQPLFSAQPGECAPREDYLAAYQRMVEEDPAALSIFARMAEAWPADPLVKLHLRRLKNGETGEVIADRRGLGAKAQPAKREATPSPSLV